MTRTVPVWLLLLCGGLLLMTAGAGVRLDAQAAAQPPAGTAAPADAGEPPAEAVAPPGDAADPPGDEAADEAEAAEDGWDFEDEKEAAVPTWGDQFKAQGLELAEFSAFAALALVSFFRKSVKLKYVTLVAAILYLGLYRSQLISIVNIFGLFTLNLPILEHNLGWYLFATFSLATTILFGRLYCGRICAYGALTQLLDQVVPAKLRVNVPVRIEEKAAYIKYGLLAAVLLYFFTTRDFSIFRYVEPFWMFTGSATTGLWIGLGVLLVATVFIRNLYCRFLCPVGAFLGILSNLTVFRIKRWAECKTCKICEKTCEWGAIKGPKIVKSECVRCDDCERLYLDQQKCPHWIILIRKADIMARRSVAPSAPAGS